MTKKKFALFGCGMFGANHVKELDKRDDAEIVALVDPNKDIRLRLIDGSRSLSQNRPIEFADPVSFFESDIDYDAGLVVTQPQHMYKIARGLLENGKHAYVEKPFAISSEDARKLVELANEKNLVLTVGANRCVYPAYRTAANALRNGEIGNAEAFLLYYRRRFPYWKNENQTWRDNPSVPGSGLLFDQGSHFNIYLFGSLGFKPSKVRLLQTKLNDSGVDIADAYKLTDPNGRTALILMDGTYQGDDRTELIKIYGDSGTITVRFEGNSSNAYLLKGGKETCLDKTAAIAEARYLGIEDPTSHPALVHNFVSQLTGATETNASPANYGYLSVRTIDAINRSRGLGPEEHAKPLRYSRQLTEDVHKLGSILNPYTPTGFELDI